MFSEGVHQNKSINHSVKCIMFLLDNIIIYWYEKLIYWEDT
jgi:hypothetical protein